MTLLTVGVTAIISPTFRKLDLREAVEAHETDTN